MTEDDLPTPCFLLDAARLRTNLETAQRLREEAECRILLATKAFALPAAFPMMSGYLDGTTASGEHEAMLGAETFGKEVHVYSPAYTQGEIERLTQADLTSSAARNTPKLLELLSAVEIDMLGDLRQPLNFALR
ncbi:MAG: carboxynorspermidine decarboxylase, partial [Pseudomonadota bacterium]